MTVFNVKYTLIKVLYYSTKNLDFSNELSPNVM